MRGGVKPLVGRNRPGRRQRNVRRSRGLGVGASSPSSRRTPTGTGPSGRSAGPRGGRRRLGVLTLSEAAELRAAGLHGHILVMAPSSRRGPGRRAARDRVTVDSPALARFLSRPGTAPGPNPSELDYGLDAGARPSAAAALLQDSGRMPGVEAAGLSATPRRARQERRRAEDEAPPLRPGRRGGHRLPGLEVHANSAVALDFPTAASTWPAWATSSTGSIARRPPSRTFALKAASSRCAQSRRALDRLLLNYLAPDTGGGPPVGADGGDGTGERFIGFIAVPLLRAAQGQGAFRQPRGNRPSSST